MTALETPAGHGTLSVLVTGCSPGDEPLLVDGTVDVVGTLADVRNASPSAFSAAGLSAVLHCVPAGYVADAATLARDASAIRQHTLAPIILLVTDATADLADAAFEAGMDDVLVLPQMADSVGFAIRKANRPDARHVAPADPAVATGKVITVFSPKGGTGKTVLSTNLSAYLAARSDQRVLLIDLDLQFGDAAIMLDVEPSRTMYELVLAPGELDAGKLEAFTTRHRSGLHVLAAPLLPEHAELVTEAKVLRLLEVARDAYDVVVVDTSPFFYGPMLALLQPTDELLLLCGLDVPTLKNVRLSLRTLDQLGFPTDRTSLVLNRVAADVGLTAGDVETALDLPVRFEIPNDPAVALAVNRGAAAALVDDESPFAQALAQVAEAIVPTGSSSGHGAVDTGAGSSTTRRRWLGRRRLLEGRV
jgi:pilus assembly protein CpaE